LIVWVLNDGYFSNTPQIKGLNNGYKEHISNGETNVKPIKNWINIKITILTFNKKQKSNWNVSWFLFYFKYQVIYIIFMNILKRFFL